MWFWRHLNESAGKFFETRVGKLTAGGLVMAVVLLLVWWLRGSSEAQDISRTREYICSKTLKTFKVTLEPGMQIPIKSPFSSENTGFPVENCNWTTDGGIKTSPTKICLNEYRGIPGPTFCPDCGRLVRGHNPPADAAVTPPETEAEYHARHSRRLSNASPANAQPDADADPDSR